MAILQAARITRAAYFSSSSRVRAAPPSSAALRSPVPRPALPRSRAARRSSRSVSPPGMKSSLPALMVAAAVARGCFMSLRVMPSTTQSVMTSPPKPHSRRRITSSSWVDSEVWTPLMRL